MLRDEWRKAWIDTLVEAGIFLDTAEDTFDVCYASQSIDLTSDPVFAASAFIPTQVHRQMYLDGNDDAAKFHTPKL
jgi:hypothetical protein